MKRKSKWGGILGEDFLEEYLIMSDLAGRENREQGKGQAVLKRGTKTGKHTDHQEASVQQLLGLKREERRIFPLQAVVL